MEETTVEAEAATSRPAAPLALRARVERVEEARRRADRSAAPESQESVLEARLARVPVASRVRAAAARVVRPVRAAAWRVLPAASREPLAVSRARAAGRQVRP